MYIRIIATVVLGLLFAVPASAEWAPKDKITLQIGFGAGGETDTVGRVVASVLEEQTGWQVIAENKPGGGGVAMFSGMTKAPADGSIIGMGVNVPTMINLIVRGDKLPFDLDSFDYLATVGQAEVVMVAAKDAPFDDLASMVKYSKSKGGIPITFDTKPQELMIQKINKDLGAGLKPLPVKSTAEHMQMLLGGQVELSFAAGTHLPYLRNGDIKMLAVVGKNRVAYSPETKTLSEQGLDIYVDAYFYIAAPKGLADDTKATLIKALAKAIGSEKVRSIIEDSMSMKRINLGADGAKKMLVDGMKSVAPLFDK